MAMRLISTILILIAFAPVGMVAQDLTQVNEETVKKI
jgi:hypothetical protein